LCGIRFVPTCSIGNGISWIELYVLFLVHAKQTSESTSGKAGPSLCRRLRVFTSYVRRIVNCFLVDDGRVHFKPSIKRESRLQMLGIQSHTPAMRFLPVVSHATGEAIAKVVLSLFGPLTTLRSALHSDGRLPLQLKRAKFKPAPKWHKWLLCVPTDFHYGTRRLDRQQTENECVTGDVVHDAFWLFQCPQCDYARLANATMFQLKALARPLWCGACQVLRPTKQWTCECGEPWFLRPRHGKPPAKIHR